MTTTTAPATPQPETAGDQQLDIEAMFPADPDLMVSPEGDRRGLKKLQDKARERRSELGWT